ncbi:ABC transporter ATP-binding protein [Bosea caraganae]|uniref:ABC transporter ATP-binding protein n=1 Tax=Bosea caraganae TaxID=2763117 RepID=A0A370L9U6_9HYPH|nr:cyclic nucleotide-binding domain-containing protein [Bosea caraganae]RDJ21864.1 ABC transporter ATP-binding protein [Bosea caraganae]RDJ28105.1 ABC transporter ATP-binding protein [Bosea caraganae]
MVEIFSYIWRNSRSEQIRLILIVLLSLPFYYLSLELPKYIIGDAIQGRAFPDGRETARLFHLSVPAWLGGGREVFAGVDFDRTSYLFVLSGLFLLLVMINGGFKYVVNMRKGALGERLLQRLRFDLFAMLLSFPPEARRHLKPSEAATVIKDEVEPIGGFVGDAFVQPVLLGGQALTALAFILLQNLALGLIALAIVAVQAVIIPRLRREQLRLGKQRQLASRALAGKIGEVVEALGEVANHGTSAAEKSLVAERLETLFGIRYRLYGRKFAVKFLNNLLAQVTPFLFYTVGGYFALSGRLDIGQLVAVIAAYRDLPTPIKELIDWDQDRLDVETRFQQINRHFALDAPRAPPEPPASTEPAQDAFASGTIAVKGLTVLGATGERLLDRISLTLPLGAHIALSDRSSEAASALAQVLGGGITAFDGAVTLAGIPLGAVTPEQRGRSLAYLGPEPVVFDGTLRDNILYGLGRASGNAAQGDAEELERDLVKVLATVGLADTVFRFGLQHRLASEDTSGIAIRIAQLRALIRARLIASGAGEAVEPFDPARYTRNATIGDNILFGVTTDASWTPERLAGEPALRALLDAHGLTERLVRIGRRIAATMIEIFRDLPDDHVLFEQFSFFAAGHFGEYRDILARHAAGALQEADRTRLIALAFLYAEPRHRLGLLRPSDEDRILAARHAFRRQAPPALAKAVAFYDPERYCPAAPLRDNLLFGSTTGGGGTESQRATAAMRESLAELGLDGEAYRLGLERQAGYGGQSLFPSARVALALARCLIKRPRILILDEALAPFGEAEAARLLARVRLFMQGRTLLVAGRQVAGLGPFDARIEFHGPRSVSSPDIAVQAEAGPEAILPDEDGAADSEELRALRSVPIFAEIDTPRLKLLAFTGERVGFAAGETIVRQGDESDAAYLLISGSADVLSDSANGSVRIAGMTGYALFGEMGIVTGEPRSATIVAATPVVALRLRQEVFVALFTEFPQMALSVTRLIVRRLQDNLAAFARREDDDG